jgi:hypothetical protein
LQTNCSELARTGHQNDVLVVSGPGSISRVPDIPVLAVTAIPGDDVRGREVRAGVLGAIEAGSKAPVRA